VRVDSGGDDGVLGRGNDRSDRRSD
jgi:hypothetical protein